MYASIPHRHLWSSERLSSADLQALLHTGAALKRAKLRDPSWGPLRGRHLALLANGSDSAANPLGADDSARAFARAVHELGGTVTVLDARDWLSSAGARIPEAARMLGRLYDAIDCYGLPAALLEQIEAHCGVPVFNGLAQAAHPIGGLSDLLTMREASGKPLHETRLLMAGASTADAQHAAAELARLAGMAVEREATAAVTANNGAAHALGVEPDFILDASAPPAQGRLVRPGATAGQQEQLVGLLADNRVTALQAAIVCGLH
jgi:ornithine carbamoyltransferase